MLALSYFLTDPDVEIPFVLTWAAVTILLIVAYIIIKEWLKRRR